MICPSRHSNSSAGRAAMARHHASGKQSNKNTKAGRTPMVSGFEQSNEYSREGSTASTKAGRTPMASGYTRSNGHGKTIEQV